MATSLTPTRQATFLTGYSNDELVTRHLAILYPNPEDRIKADYELNLALKKGKLSVQEVKTRKDQTLFWAEMIVSPIYGQQNECTGYSCLLLDISEKKKKNLLSVRMRELPPDGGRHQGLRHSFAGYDGPYSNLE
jgi:PAS domain S-box-containing protein